MNALQLKVTGSQVAELGVHWEARVVLREHELPDLMPDFAQ